MGATIMISPPRSTYFYLISIFWSAMGVNLMDLSSVILYIFLEKKFRALMAMPPPPSLFLS